MVVCFLYLQNDDGETALHCAAQYGHTGTVDVLLQVSTQATLAQ